LKGVNEFKDLYGWAITGIIDVKIRIDNDEKQKEVM